MSAALSRDALTVLAKASSRLAESLDWETTLAAVAEILIPAVADGCVVDVIESDGHLRRIVATHVEPEKAVWAAKLKDLAPAPPGAALYGVLAATAPIVSPEITDESLRPSARSPEHWEILKALEIRSGMMTPLRSQGKPIGALWVFSSSSRHYGEEEVLLFWELACRAGASIENAQLFDQARRAIALRDEFLSVASHELNTPLTSLRLVVDSLRRRGHAPDVASRLDTAHRQVTRLGSLVAKLLDVSRLGTAQLAIDRAPADLAVLVEESVAGLADDIEQRGVTVNVTAPHGVATGQWDAARLEQVILNLLTNALKYGAGKPVDVIVSATDDEAVLVVRDHGIGISPADHNRIFGRFERAVSSKKFGGLGLGLFIACEIVRAHGGVIEIDSKLDQGATFRVRLPRRGQ